MRALAAGVFGLLVGSRAFAEEARTSLFICFRRPNAGGAVQMARHGRLRRDLVRAAERRLARAREPGRVDHRTASPDRARASPLAISRDDLLRRPDRLHRGRNEPHRHHRHGRGRHGVRHPDAREQPSRDRRSSTRSGSPSTTGTGSAGFEPGAPVRSSEFPIPTFASGPLGITPRSGSGRHERGLVHREPGQQDRADRRERRDHGVSRSRRPTAVRRRSWPDSDGANFMYFIETRGNKIGRITPSGQITEFTVPTPNSSPADSRPMFVSGRCLVRGEDRREARLDVARRRVPRVPASGHGAAGEHRDSTSSDTVSSRRSAVWYLDGTNRRVGRLSDNHLFAIGAGTFETLRHGVRVLERERRHQACASRLAVRRRLPGVLPRDLHRAGCSARAQVETAASEVPFSLDQRLFQITGIEPEISDVPETRAPGWWTRRDPACASRFRSSATGRSRRCSRRCRAEATGRSRS